MISLFYILPLASVATFFDTPRIKARSPSWHDQLPWIWTPGQEKRIETRQRWKNQVKNQVEKPGGKNQVKKPGEKTRWKIRWKNQVEKTRWKTRCWTFFQRSELYKITEKPWLPTQRSELYKITEKPWLPTQRSELYKITEKPRLPTRFKTNLDERSDRPTKAKPGGKTRWKTRWRKPGEKPGGENQVKKKQEIQGSSV